MDCREFELEWVGLEDSGAFSPVMEEHRLACRTCSEMVEDLTYISEQARQLRTLESPPERVWARIRLQLEQEGLIREPVAVPPAVTRRSWWLRFPMGVAYASMFVMGLGVVYLHSLLTNPSSPPLLAVQPNVPQIAMQRPDLSREQDLQTLVQSVPEEHRAIFVNNWNQVNTSINTLSTFVDAHPEDPFARTQLMNAIQQRELLWDTLVKSEQF